MGASPKRAQYDLKAAPGRPSRRGINRLRRDLEYGSCSLSTARLGCAPEIATLIQDQIATRFESVETLLGYFLSE